MRRQEGEIFGPQVLSRDYNIGVHIVSVDPCPAFDHEHLSTSSVYGFSAAKDMLQKDIISIGST
jgi:hypothetical protein